MSETTTEPEYPPANDLVEIGEIVKQFVDGVNSQITKADAAGADEDDLCVMLAAGYFSVIFGMPIITLPNRHNNDTPRKVALVTKAGARSLIKTVLRESGWTP